MQKNIDGVKHMSLWKRSGKSIRDYCSDAGLSYYSFKNFHAVYQHKITII